MNGMGFQVAQIRQLSERISAVARKCRQNCSPVPKPPLEQPQIAPCHTSRKVNERQSFMASERWKLFPRSGGMNCAHPHLAKQPVVRWVIGGGDRVATVHLETASFGAKVMR